MTLVIFRAVTPDGAEVIGPIQGNAGMVASGCLPDRAQWGAETVILRAQLDARRKGRSVLPCSWPGHATMYPHYSAESNGPAVFVPLAQSRITVYEVKP